ncbi:TPA: hypothetical protein HA241_01175 [Candidatus Woesearchaeota archaeon]|nr:hypothetical protein [Candidatus Woesearchaeota archaeon]
MTWITGFFRGQGNRNPVNSGEGQSIHRALVLDSEQIKLAYGTHAEERKFIQEKATQARDVVIGERVIFDPMTCKIAGLALDSVFSRLSRDDAMSSGREDAYNNLPREGQRVIEALQRVFYPGWDRYTEQSNALIPSATYNPLAQIIGKHESMTTLSCPAAENRRINSLFLQGPDFVLDYEIAARELRTVETSFAGHDQEYLTFLERNYGFLTRSTSDSFYRKCIGTVELKGPKIGLALFEPGGNTYLTLSYGEQLTKYHEVKQVIDDVIHRLEQAQLLAAEVFRPEHRQLFTVEVHYA